MCESDSTNIILKNERLEVVITNPGIFYRGSRFDWNGFITQITLDGKHTFCVPESQESGKGSGGLGLCGEFGIDNAIGYDEISVNDYFPKIGVGLLKKTDTLPYDFFRPYEYIPQNSNVIIVKDAVSFSYQASIHNGYAYEYHKSISISGNQIKIAYLLNNNGTKKINTTEYCHNFIGINSENVSSRYSLKMPSDICMIKNQGELCIKDNIITWPNSLMNKEFYCHAQGNHKNRGPSWELYNSNAGVGVREIDNFLVSKFALWGYQHVISPETFINIELDQGQTITWTREYEFFY